MSEHEPEALAAAQSLVGKLEKQRDHCLNQLKLNPSYELSPYLVNPLERLLQKAVDHHMTDEGKEALRDSPALLVSPQGTPGAGLPALIDLVTDSMADRYGSGLSTTPSQHRPGTSGGLLHSPDREDPGTRSYRGKQRMPIGAAGELGVAPVHPA